MDKLVFGTAGIPIITSPRDYQTAFDVLEELNLGGMEVEFVRGVNMNPQTMTLVKRISKEKNLVLTAHGPYFINLNAEEPEKIEASKKRILDTARAANNFGGYSITFHAGFYLKQDKETVYRQIHSQMAKIIETAEKESLDVWIRPETTGKGTQWGDLDEIIRLSKEFDKVLPCVDFSHLHARSAGQFNTYDEFASIFEKIGNELGDYALKNFHAHIAGIEYGQKGEKRHLMLGESDFNYKDLMKAFKNFDIKGVIICESPNMEEDAMLLQKTFLNL
ncbi:MAG: TIM barrel protein [Candidatus Gastranaerophilales bacterium]|nr:TIM barrel protein [Candidatus Gastranaerophilales bacterium]